MTKIILTADGRVKCSKGHAIGKYTKLDDGRIGAVILTPDNAFTAHFWPELCTRVYAANRVELRAKIAEIYAEIYAE